jgi:HEAT repeat protein
MKERMKMKTYGRRPTIGEIEEYYARAEVLEFIYEDCQTRTVNVSFKGGGLHQGLYEMLQPRNMGDLRERLERIFRDWVKKAYAKRAARERVSVEEVRPDMFGFLSFHNSAVISGERKEKGFDLILEPDLAGWRRSFEEMTGLIRILEEFEVCFRLKYSGVRSLHLIIPWEALPVQFRGRPLKGRRKWLVQGIRRYGRRHCGLKGADSPGFLRMAYSLNEDNGLVSVPIDPAQLSSFRPWQANMHNVKVNLPWHGQVPKGASRKTLRFMREVFDRKGGKKAFSFGLEMGRPARIETGEGDGWREQLRSGEEGVRLAAAWGLLHADEPVSPDLLRIGLEDENPDVRWYATEALQRGTDDERMQLAARMLVDLDPFVRISAGDALRLAPQEMEQVLDILVESVEREGGELPFRAFIDLFLDVVYVIEKLCVGRPPELRGRVLMAGGRAIARLLERTVSGTQEESGGRWLKLLRNWGNWLWRLRSTCVENEFSVAAMFGPAIELCLDKLAGEGEEREIALRLYAGILERLFAREAAALGALLAVARRLGMAIAEPPELVVDGGEKEQLLAAIAGNLDRKSDAELIRLVVRLLRDGGDRVSALAAQVMRGLDRSPEEFVQIFSGMMEDESGMVRSSCVRVLGELGGASGVSVLVSALGDSDKYVRQEAVAALKRVGVAAVPALSAALGEKNGTLASHAALALGELEAEETVAALREALGERTTGHNAARALGQIGGPAAVSALIGVLESEHQGVRLGAIEGLGRIGDRVATPALMRLLGDENTAIRSRTIQALGRLGAEEVVPQLVEALQDEGKAVRNAALRSLAQLGGPRSLSALIEALSDERLRSGAVWALGSMGNSAAGEVLVGLLRDENRSIRGTVVNALATLGLSTPEVIEGLGRVLHDEDEWVGHLAAKALRKIGTEEARVHLRG